MDEINKLKTKIETYKGIEKDNNKSLVKQDNKILLEKITKQYNKNTKEKQETAFKINEVSIKISDLKKKINEKRRLLSELSHKEGATISNMKKNLYDNNKFSDNKKVYYLISGIHSLILLTMLIGLTNIINSTIIVIVIVILYIVIGILLFTKFNKNTNRNKFNYNEFDIDVKNTGVCSFSPSTLQNSKKKEVQDKDDLNKIKSLLNNN